MIFPVKFPRRATSFALACIAASLLVVGVDVRPAAAGDFCDELWHSRNQIYARNGHCFNTARGRATFGPGCFPPYGRLSGAEQRRVNQIQRQERENGC